MEIFSAVSNLPDDCVEYTIFLRGGRDSPATKLEKEAKLENIASKARILSEPWTREYIWQRQEFNAKVVEFLGEPCLRGVTQFGDCIDDEWLIVFILRELSKKSPDIVIKQVFGYQRRITDSDGEFLLIEAANAIPKWLNPDNADNRVWIYNGNLCIIPTDDPDSATSYTLHNALQFLGNNEGMLYHPQILQKEAFARLKSYPRAIEENIHRSKVFVPRRVAQILHHNPRYIAPACEAFLLRDPISMKVCSTMANFPPEDSVTCVVKLTRLLYTQIKSQRIIPPLKFRIPKANEEGYDEAELGMKIACGFELLCAGYGKSKLRKQKDYSTDPKFKEYMRALKNEGFFKHETPGTPMYERLVSQARKTFAEVSGDSYNTSDIGAEIIHGLESMDKLSDEEIATWDRTVDDDKWMDIDFAEFEGLLDANARAAASDDDQPEDPDGAKREVLESQEKVKSIVDRLRKFMDDEKAGFDGIEFDNDMSDSDEEEATQSSRIEDLDEDEVNEDDFFEFFLKEALKLSPEEIEQFRADPSPELKRRRNGGITSSGEREGEQEEGEQDEDEDEDDDVASIAEELQAKGIISEGENDDVEIMRSLLESIKSQEGGAGPGSNLLERLGF
ncbi:SGT1 protein-domain-containing protein [Lipomyces kononenkoae]|uniref:SGT1 protein-domain-containing protein n=1 Tax=Lipomyces kononenkoae TaxID=34357 RepID=A0ACC3T7N0_LIPKO